MRALLRAAAALLLVLAVADLVRTLGPLPLTGWVARVAPCAVAHGRPLRHLAASLQGADPWTALQRWFVAAWAARCAGTPGDGRLETTVPRCLARLRRSCAASRARSSA